MELSKNPNAPSDSIEISPKDPLVVLYDAILYAHDNDVPFGEGATYADRGDLESMMLRIRGVYSEYFDPDYLPENLENEIEIFGRLQPKVLLAVIDAYIQKLEKDQRLEAVQAPNATSQVGAQQQSETEVVRHSELIQTRLALMIIRRDLEAMIFDQVTLKAIRDYRVRISRIEYSWAVPAR